MPRKNRQTWNPLQRSNQSADGFRNYLGKGQYTRSSRGAAAGSSKAQLLTLTAPEMTLLVGGMRVLKRQCWPDPRSRCFHYATWKLLTNDYLREPARHEHRRGSPSSTSDAEQFEGHDHEKPASRSGLALPSRPCLRLERSTSRSWLKSTEADDSPRRNSCDDFVAAWGKVMNS